MSLINACSNYVESAVKLIYRWSNLDRSSVCQGKCFGTSHATSDKFCAALLTEELNVRSVLRITTDLWRLKTILDRPLWSRLKHYLIRHLMEISRILKGVKLNSLCGYKVFLPLLIPLCGTAVSIWMVLLYLYFGFTQSI